LKNLLLAIAGATTLAQAGLPAGDDAIVWSVFVVLATMTIAGPVVYYLAGGESAHRKLDELKGWLGRNNAVVMVVLLLVIGLKLCGDGISGLSA
jgi:Sap, sulfolipid-1-addressing protein